MKKLYIINLIVVTFVMFSGVFAIVHADTAGLVPCGNVEDTTKGVVTDACGFADLVVLAQAVMKFLIFDLAAPIAAIMFAYAGFTYVTNGGNESKIKQAHDIFLYVFWGLIIALSAWLVVNFILSFLVGSEFNFLGS